MPSGPVLILGATGAFGGAVALALIERGEAIRVFCRDAGKACGTHLADPDPEAVSRAFEQGYTFVVLSSDLFLLWKWAERMNTLMDEQRPGP